MEVAAGNKSRLVSRTEGWGGMRRTVVFVAIFVGASIAWFSLAGPGDGGQDRGPKPDPAKPESPFVISKEEQELIELTNKEREKENLPPLTPAEKLFQAARAHSQNMAKQDKMDHVLDGKNPLDRIKETGYGYLHVAENIAWAHKRTLAEVMENWMKSPTHKANILDKRFTQIGVGLAANEQGRVYYTQVFGTPKAK
jgi:uncharacterized protein YkwD